MTMEASAAELRMLWEGMAENQARGAATMRQSAESIAGLPPEAILALMDESSEPNVAALLTRFERATRCNANAVHVFRRELIVALARAKRELNHGG